MLPICNGCPNDERAFVHKRIIGGLKGFVTSGFNPLAAASGFLTAGGGAKSLPIATQPLSIAQQAAAITGVGFVGTAAQIRRKVQIAQHALHGHFQKASTIESHVSGVVPGLPLVASGDGCVFPMRRDPLTGDCRVFLGTQSGRDPVAGGGEVVMGRYGAAMAPGMELVQTSRCLPGDVLGDDGLCYPKRNIKNSDRMWPKGRKPLGTPGELAALSKAAAFGRRMKSTVKSMEKIGVLKKPSRGRSAAAVHHAK